METIKDIIKLIKKFNMHGDKYLLAGQGVLCDGNLKDDLIKEINKLNKNKGEIKD